jgi:cytochrome c-type biogenesis protein CcmH
MTLWIILIGMTMVAGLIATLPILRQPIEADQASHDIVVYADQLAEVERDRERGLIGVAEAAAAKTEISRRILKAGQTPEVAAKSLPSHAITFAVLAVLAIASLSFGLYARLGSPTTPDLPLAERKLQAPERMSPDELIARLDDALAKHPDDLKGWDVAGPVYLRVGRTDDAITAFRKAIALGGADARRDAGLGEALVAAANGVVTSEARALFEAATRLEPEMPTPKMYLALALSQDGKLEESAAAWRAIIAAGRGYEPWVKAAKRELAGVEAKLYGPTNVDASQPPPSDPPAVLPADDANRSMIETMVAGLGARLEKDGGSAEDWGKLIKSYRVLGRDEDARSVYEKAKAALAAKPEELAALNKIATSLGVSGAVQ